MSDNEKTIRIDEGGLRKGGLNPAPSIPRPSEAPPAPQQPEQPQQEPE